MSVRAEILGKIKNGLDAVESQDVRRQTAAARLAAPPEHLVPARSQGDQETQTKLFIEMAEGVAASTARIPSLAGVPDAVARYLARHNLPSRVRTDNDPLLARIDWSSQATLEVTSGPPTDGDQVSVTVAYGGVAETGTAVLTSGEDHPTTLNFLPETHIIVLPLSRLRGTYEEVWESLRSDHDTGGDTLPRTVNWITGPSRTGDIEQTMQLGIHGPQRLLVILVKDNG